MNLKNMKIVSAKPLENHNVEIHFKDGSMRIVDLEPFLSGPIFESVRNNREIFEDIRIEGGTLSWSTGGDIDPYVLYFGGVDKTERKLVNQRLVKSK